MAMDKILCKVCGGECHKSKALLDEIIYFESKTDLGGSEGATITQSFGTPNIISCFKCKNCGHSFTLTELQNETELYKFGTILDLLKKHGII